MAALHTDDKNDISMEEWSSLGGQLPCYPEVLFIEV